MSCKIRSVPTIIAMTDARTRALQGASLDGDSCFLLRFGRGSRPCMPHAAAGRNLGLRLGPTTSTPLLEIIDVLARCMQLQLLRHNMPVLAEPSITSHGSRDRTGRSRLLRLETWMGCVRNTLFLNGRRAVPRRHSLPCIAHPPSQVGTPAWSPREPSECLHVIRQAIVGHFASGHPPQSGPSREYSKSRSRAHDGGTGVTWNRLGTAGHTRIVPASQARRSGVGRG